MKAIFAFVFVAPFICPQESIAEDQVPDDPRLAARVQEIESYEPVTGTWEGHFFVTSAPDELMAVLEETGTKENGARIRILLSEQEDPQVYLMYPDYDDWKLMEGEIVSFANSVGWYIYLEQGDGVWIEKLSLTFDRVKEREASMTFTRTVHNWFIPEPTPDVVDFYHMFGVGKVEKIDVP